MLKKEIHSRTISQIRTHSQKFFLKVAKVAPSAKDLVEFVKETPTSYFLGFPEDEVNGNSDEAVDNVQNKKEPARVENSPIDLPRQYLPKRFGEVSFKDYPVYEAQRHFPFINTLISSSQIVSMTPRTTTCANMELHIYYMMKAIEAITQRSAINNGETSHWEFLHEVGKKVYRLIQEVEAFNCGFNYKGSNGLSSMCFKT